MSIANKLQSLPKNAIYGILILCTSVPLFFKIPMPNNPDQPSKDFFRETMTLDPSKPVLLASDWTNSTRGESKAHMKSLLRMFMRRGQKFALYSTADPQAPQVALDVIAEVNREREKKQQSPYKRFEDYVVLGYFPNAEAAINGLANDFKSTVKGRKDFPVGKEATDVFQSPVMKDVDSIKDFQMVFVITASKTSNFTVERVYGKTKLAFAVTGVMGPETQVYYQSKQLVGFVNGLKGAFDIEQLMEKGLNVDASPSFRDSTHPEPIQGFPGEDNIGQGTRYYPTLHFAMALMIIMVILGNVGMVMAKKEKGGR